MSHSSSHFAALATTTLQRRRFLQHSAFAVSMLMAGSVAQAQVPPQGQAHRPILVFGDSLSAEYGLVRGQGWVAALQSRVAPKTIVNASVSGETTSGGLARLPALLKQHQPSHVLIELGANDALRGLDLQQTESHLRQMIALCRAQQAQVLLIGMRIPPNYGPQYSRQFENLYTQLARQEKTAFVPFLLANVADTPQPEQWFLSDGLHPNASAQPRIADTVWQVAGPWLKKGTR